jgi:hypothetical protein
VLESVGQRGQWFGHLQQREAFARILDPVGQRPDLLDRPLGQLDPLGDRSLRGVRLGGQRGRLLERLLVRR